MVKLLIVLVIILGILAVIQLTRVYELTSKLRGKKEEEIPTKDNRTQGTLMLLFMFAFYAFCIWQLVAYEGEILNDTSASKHGREIDTLLNFNFIILFIVFFLTHTLLFFFAFKYYGREGRKALFYPHNNKLELIWTSIPAIFLAVVIIYGLTTWNHITEAPSEDAMTVELYGKQFDWTARYPGEDGKLGKTNYNLISPTNPLGIITPENIKKKRNKLEEKIADMEKTLEEKGNVLPDWKVDKLHDDIGKRERQISRINALKDEGVEFTNGYDDKLVKGEFHLPVDKEVSFVIRAREVIHSAYMPHFRAQMNAVPGIKTHFKYTPVITTDSMRTIKDDKNFNYLLLCNKICGAAHYNMQMDIVVDEMSEYEKWIGDQKTFAESAGIEPDKQVKLAEKTN